MKNILTFEDHSRLVWEPKRRPNDARYMPDSDKQSEYRSVVTEELKKHLRETYQLNDTEIEQKISVIWNQNYSDWKHILDDSLCNWDTPDICAQKCLTFFENFGLFNKKTESS